MLYYCLQICRILLKLYIQSTEQMCDCEHIRCFLLLVSLLLNTGLGSLHPYNRLLEAAVSHAHGQSARPSSPLIRARCGAMRLC